MLENFFITIARKDGRITGHGVSTGAPVDLGDLVAEAEGVTANLARNTAVEASNESAAAAAPKPSVEAAALIHAVVTGLWQLLGCAAVFASRNGP